MKTISIALKDLQILFKDRGALFQLFILPLLFIMVFSGALSAIGGGSEEQAALPNLAVVDLDGGEAAMFLLNKIQEDGSFSVQSLTVSDVQSQLDENKVVAVLTIPAGFTARCSGKHASHPGNCHWKECRSTNRGSHAAGGGKHCRGYDPGKPDHCQPAADG